MAVELRCPDCRAKLRLKEDPEPGTEVECPECGAVFNAPDPDTGEVPDARTKKKAAGDKPRKRPADEDEDDDDDDRPKKPADGEKKADKSAADKKKQPRRRKAKKKETNKGALIAVIVVGVLFLAVAIGLLVWFFTRKPASYEMMTYLPADATSAVGLNIGHMHKYSEFIKVVEPTYKEMGFQKAIDALAKAFGIEPRDVPDYMVQGDGKSGGALVIRTKKEFDPGDLAKLSGAQKGTLDGETYYRISPIPKVFGGGGVRVFAPTSRIVVFVDDAVQDRTLRQMMAANKGEEENTLYGKVRPLAKRVTRGTFWAIGMFDTGNRPTAPKDTQGGGDSSGVYKSSLASNTETAKGFGFKASLGSRSVRFEVVLTLSDADAAKERVQKYFGKDSEFIKAQDDSSVEPPKLWKGFEQQLGSKKVAAELFSNLGAKSSGELFIVYSECDTKPLMDVLSGLVGKITGQTPGAGGPGMGGGGMGPPPGGGVPPMGPGPGAAPPP